MNSSKYIVSAPPRPQVRVHSSTSTSISILWSVPAGSAVGDYQVVWGLRGEEKFATVSRLESTYTITPLEPGSIHRLSVAATNAAGSNGSSIILAHTGI